MIEKYESLLTYSKRESKFYKGDPTIKDVCAHCNNVLLSKLDSYLASLYDAHFHQILLPGEQASISYDHELLLRALLKVSFNSARADASEKVVKAHKGLINFMLHGGYRPPVELRLQIVTASRAINLNEGTEKFLEPRHLRCAEIPYDGPMSHRFVVRMIAINCYWFFLVLPYKNEPPHKWRDLVCGLTAWRMNLGVKLLPSVSTMIIPVNKTTYLQPTLLGNLVHAFHV
ncbi:hypothetical protein [Ramlibacter sp. WS9]|uniref:hypothetical protein n=1 Tax=Ramlibacter sp. WS9 TaxID=1882741 RepID=UPI0011436067|nr:hypothetical protein [Ramlibacter sp. WS9]ROZ72087.1 hypothetical protein EEB15_20120 [Ramlibacter sp. WS9]